jgi:glutamate-ammonia-ligase adenylyltransferase
LWQWQALCKARPVFGAATTRAAAARLIRQLLTSRPWRPGDAAELLAARLKIEQGASSLNIKRGTGGTLDIELAVQRLQLEHCSRHAQILEPFTLKAIQALGDAGVMPAEAAAWWSESYRLLRRVECGIRLMNLRARHELPSENTDLQRLAILLAYPTPDELHVACTRTMTENRRRLLTLPWPTPDS